MTMKTPVLSLLLRYINNVKKKDNNYDIAQAMLNNYNDICKLTIHELAEKCYVSSSSISRFIRLMGYENYTSFKDACSDSIGINVDYSLELSKATKKDIKPIYQRYTDNVKSNLDFIFETIDYLQLERICQMIYNTKDVAFFGLEFATLLGQHFQIKMAELNKLVKIGNTFNEQKEIAESFEEGGVVIIASLEGGYFYHNDEILKILKNRKVKIVALTMNTNSMIVRQTDEIVIISKHNSDTEGRISLLYMIELLLMYYVINYQAISL